MRVLIVAHPDDEILWFDDPASYDRIIMVFGERPDLAGAGERRRMAIHNHPLLDKITALGIPESNHWRDKSALARAQHEINYGFLCKFLATLQADEVTTHNAMGEYRHLDHILVYNACMAMLTCKVNNKDPALYRAIKQAYVNAGCWTWY